MARSPRCRAGKLSHGTDMECGGKRVSNSATATRIGVVPLLASAGQLGRRIDLSVARYFSRLCPPVCLRPFTRAEQLWQFHVPTGTISRSHAALRGKSPHTEETPRPARHRCNSEQPGKRLSASRGLRNRRTIIFRSAVAAPEAGLRTWHGVLFELLGFG